MSDFFQSFDPVFFEKNRLSILTILYKEKNAIYNQLKTILQISDGAIYSHLEKLKESGYIDRKKEILPDESIATRYWLTEKGKHEFNRYIVTLEQIIAQSKGGIS